MELILLNYINRSGSTFLSNAMDKSPSVLACPEADIFVDLFLTQPHKLLSSNNKKTIKAKLLSDPKFKTWNFTSHTIESLIFAGTGLEAFIEVLKCYRDRAKPNARFVLYKAENLFNVIQNFPLETQKRFKLNFISITRDIRGIYCSQIHTNIPESGKKMAQNPVFTSIYWNKYIKKINAYTSYYVLQITYEDLIGNYDSCINKIFQSLKLEATLLSNNSELYHRLSTKHKAIHSGVLRTPILNKINLWQSELSSFEIAIIERISKKNLLKLNLQLARTRAFLPYIYVYIYYYRIIACLQMTGKKIKFKINKLND